MINKNKILFFSLNAILIVGLWVGYLIYQRIETNIKSKIAFKEDYQYALTLLSEGKFNQGLRLLKSVSLINLNDSQKYPFYVLEALFYSKEKPSLALKKIKQAQNIKDDNLARFVEGLIYENMGSEFSHRALSSYQEIFNQKEYWGEENFDIIYHKLANWYYENQDYQKAQYFLNFLNYSQNQPTTIKIYLKSIFLDFFNDQEIVSAKEIPNLILQNKSYQSLLQFLLALNEIKKINHGNTQDEVVNLKLANLHFQNASTSSGLKNQKIYLLSKNIFEIYLGIDYPQEISPSQLQESQKSVYYFSSSEKDFLSSMVYEAKGDINLLQGNYANSLKNYQFVSSSLIKNDPLFLYRIALDYYLEKDYDQANLYINRLLAQNYPKEMTTMVEWINYNIKNAYLNKSNIKTFPNLSSAFLEKMDLLNNTQQKLPFFLLLKIIEYLKQKNLDSSVIELVKKQLVYLSHFTDEELLFLYQALAESAIQINQYPKAKSYYQKIINYQSQTLGNSKILIKNSIRKIIAESYNALAKLAIIEQKPQLALAYLSQAESSQPSTEIYFNQFLIYRELENKQQGLVALNKAYRGLDKVEPKQKVDMLLVFAQHFAQQKNFPQSWEYLKKAQLIDPHHIKVKYFLEKGFSQK